MKTKKAEWNIRCSATFYKAATFLAFRVTIPKVVREFVPSIERARALSRAILDWAGDADKSCMHLHVSIIFKLPLEDRGVLPLPQAERR